ncbi:DUF2125 domain-containing protein [Rhodobacteraceae bacterium KMM 6894]|nr:DUF2125 domain-containing protein [Rhodobacteraceae bacterium KMM 6894]
MRILLGVTVLLGALWSGYWFVGSSTAQSGMENWFETRRAEGWMAEYDDLALRGFPNRFDAGFTEISLADPGTGLAWQAPFFQLLALSYKPNHVIAVWPNQQIIATPLQTFDITSADMRASAVLAAGTSLTLDRATWTATDLAVAPRDGSGQITVGAITLAAEQMSTVATTRYHLGLSAQGVTPPDDFLTQVDTGGTLPRALETLRADLEVTFDAPWDRSAIEVARPQPRQIDVKLAEARWGHLSLKAAGSLDVDEAGMPSGKITIKAENWREIIEMARTSGALPESVAGPLRDGLSLLAGLAGNPHTLDVPLTLSGGRVWLGPVPVAKAPLIRIR